MCLARCSYCPSCLLADWHVYGWRDVDVDVRFPASCREALREMVGGGRGGARGDGMEVVRA